ncbi:hypothetical protein NPIL_150951 [Nephila pilipes]|uniref:Uncharacterized protein n=1 Tax=Nephila pilipes TaxID=299642 RepID=A0A8X6R4M1_NEPPI|nr:hypothetical protein NPIL_150951 [Nephila pilipes]
MNWSLFGWKSKKPFLFPKDEVEQFELCDNEVCPSDIPSDDDIASEVRPNNDTAAEENDSLCPEENDSLCPEED